VHLINGIRENILVDLLEEKPGTKQTYFKPGKKSSQIKKWLSYSDMNIKGEIHINEGACLSLNSNKAVSLLLIGVTGIKGDFLKGDIVRIINHDGKFVGLGKTQYNSDSAAKKIGEHHTKPIVHYDYLYLRNGD